MKTVFAELKRALTGRQFAIASIGAAVCVLIGAFSDVFAVFTVGGDMFGAHRVILLNALKSDVMLLAVPILAAIPFSASFAEDKRSGFLKQYLTRTDTGSYLWGKGASSMLSGGLAILLGIMAAFFVLFLVLSPAEYFGQRAVVSLMPKVLKYILLFFICGCLWAGVGLIASALFSNVYLAYAAPFISCYLLIILQERYLRGEFMVNPRYWLTLAGDWPLEGWSAHILLFVLCLACLPLFFIIASRRLQDRERDTVFSNNKSKEKRIAARIAKSERRRAKRTHKPSEAGQALSVAAYNFKMWRGNARIPLAFALAFILCFMLSDKAASFAFSAGTAMQAFEPFIWTFGDAGSILLMSLLLMLLFADMPYLDPGAPYYIVRMKRRTWVMGQLIYTIAATVLFMLFVFAVTTLLCVKKSFIGNMWSETAAILGYSGAGEKIVLPVLLRTLEMSRPYKCALAVFLLMLMYSLVLSLVMLLAKVRRGKAAGIVAAFAFSLWGFLLDPLLLKQVLGLSDEQMYKANVAAGWLSPLNHATYHMHSFGYDNLPKLWQTYLIFGVVSVLLMLLILKAMRRFNFDFTGTENE